MIFLSKQSLYGHFNAFRAVIKQHGTKKAFNRSIFGDAVTLTNCVRLTLAKPMIIKVNLHKNVTTCILPLERIHLITLTSCCRVLDREDSDAFYLTVMASDAGNPPLSSTTSVTIYVTDKNDNEPQVQLFIPNVKISTVSLLNNKKNSVIAAHVAIQYKGEQYS